MAVHGVNPKHNSCAIHRLVIEVLVEMDSVTPWALAGAAIVNFLGMKRQDPEVGIGPRVGRAIFG